MSLGDRLRSAGANIAVVEASMQGVVDSAEPAAPATTLSSVSTPEPESDRRIDPILDLKHRAQQALFARLGSRLYDSSLTDEQLRTFVHDELAEIVKAESIPLSDDERLQLVDSIAANVLGHGPLDEFLEDDDVTEIMVTGPGPIYVERKGRIEKTDSYFVSDEHVRRVIERIVSRVGRRIDESSPMVDARLPDGSRVNAVIPPLTVDGPSLTVRKFAKTPFKVNDLIAFKTLTPRVAELLEALVAGRVSCVVSGGTGSGKTTLLNVLSSFIPDTERIVSIEDSVELQLRQDHVVRMESRPPNTEGKGEVVIRDLVRNALRMRPDRIVVGEVRGGEALDMLQAMNTGHEGSLTTLHANSPRDALARLETMVLMAGMDLPLRAIREQIASAVGVIVHGGRLSDGSRRILQISEVTGMEGDVIQLSDLFTFDWSAGRDGDGSFAGSIQPTGLRPSFTQHLEDMGHSLPAELFGDPVAMYAKERSS